MVHKLKLSSIYFNDILENNKNFEVRKDDRHYEVGDYLYLREFLPPTAEYTGKEILAKVIYVYRGELCLPGHCIMAIEVLGIGGR